MKQNTEPLGDGVKIYNRNKQKLCNPFQHRGKIATRSQSIYNFLVENKNMNRPSTQSIEKMNSVLTLEENSGEYLKQQTKHIKYEFQTVIHYISNMKENKME